MTGFRVEIRDEHNMEWRAVETFPGSGKRECDTYEEATQVWWNEEAKRSAENIRIVPTDPRITLDSSAIEEPSPHNPGTKWQVIYKTAAGLDYARETYGTRFLPTVEKIVEKVATELNHNSKSVASARIERW